jgi:hypothetical protein
MSNAITTKLPTPRNCTYAHAVAAPAGFNFIRADSSGRVGRFGCGMGGRRNAGGLEHRPGAGRTRDTHLVSVSGLVCRFAEQFPRRSTGTHRLSFSAGCPGYDRDLEVNAWLQQRAYLQFDTGQSLQLGTGREAATRGAWRRGKYGPAVGYQMAQVQGGLTADNSLRASAGSPPVEAEWLPSALLMPEMWLKTALASISDGIGQTPKFRRQSRHAQTGVLP